jgi:hypothetical protein
LATDDDFWLLMHDMANAVNSDHSPMADKATVLAKYYAMYPPAARAHLADGFRLVLGVLQELDKHVVADMVAQAKAREKAQPEKPGTI